MVKYENNPAAIWWIKRGRGKMSLRDGRKIKGGEKFQATEAEVSGLSNWIEALEQKPSDKPKFVGKSAKFFLRQRNAQWYDVVDDQGKTINENALRKVAAGELIQELEK